MVNIYSRKKFVQPLSPAEARTASEVSGFQRQTPIPGLFRACDRSAQVGPQLA